MPSLLHHTYGSFHIDRSGEYLNFLLFADLMKFIAGDVLLLVVVALSLVVILLSSISEIQQRRLPCECAERAAAAAAAGFGIEILWFFW